jgi:hypothetical protein
MEVYGFQRTKVSIRYFELVKEYASRSSSRKDAKDKLLGSVIHGHHIHPRSLGGSDTSTNIVYITAREHYELHMLLAGMFDVGTDANKSMTFAFNSMGTEDSYAKPIIPTKKRCKKDDTNAFLRSAKPTTGEVPSNPPVVVDEAQKRLIQRANKRIRKIGEPKSDMAYVSLALAYRADPSIRPTTFEGFQSTYISVIGKKLDDVKELHFWRYLNVHKYRTTMV